MDTPIYRINPDGTFGGVETLHSDGDIDIHDHTPPGGYTFDAPANETDIWEGGAWVAPTPPTLEEIKAAKIAEINNAFEGHITGRTTISLGWDMQFNLRDILMVDGAVRTLEMTGGTEGYLTDADNVNHYDLTVQQMKQAVLEMTIAHMQAHAHKQQLRDLVTAASTAEELEPISWLL